MDRRWMLVGASVAGAALGAFVMVGMSPDTGASTEPVASLAVAAAVTRDAAPPDAGAPPEPDADAPPGEVLKGSTVEDVLSGVAPVVAAPKIYRPSEGIAVAPGCPDCKPTDAAPPADAELRADVIGLQQLFEARRQAVDACAAAAPEANDGSTSLMVVVTLVSNDGKTSIGALQVGNDADNQFTGFATCVARALQGASFAPLPDLRPRQLSWAVKR